MVRQSNSTDSLAEATRSRARFSGHGNSKGAAGYQDPDAATIQCDFLTESGCGLSVNRPEGGFPDFTIGLAWDQMVVEKESLFGLLRTKKLQNVDLDLGCLYELADGTRGALQPFGRTFGALDAPPFIQLSGDEREGDEEGDDECMTISGKNWDRIKRVVFYVYIYDGAPHWASLRPQIHVRIPGENPMIVTLRTSRSELALCALAGIENVRGGLRLSNYTEYYPGHAEMDRAFGFGLEWEEGEKVPAAR
ncbi:MAG: Tellurium resistance protein TerA [Alphaproteobacteria bacterium]|nr:Tellurium resistance protein TerA [Alphaproteobacteria bacterium]